MANQAAGTIIPINAVGAALLQNQQPGSIPTDVVAVMDWRVGAGTYSFQIRNQETGAWEEQDQVQIKQGPTTVGFNGPVVQARLVQV